MGISAVDGLDAPQAQRVQTQLETYRYRYYRKWYTWRALHRIGYRLIPLAIVPVWLVLFIIASLAGFSPSSALTPVFAAISAVIATIPVIAAVRVMLRPTGRYRVAPSSLFSIITFLFIVIVLDAVAGEGYARNLLPRDDWWAAVVLGLVAAPATLACLPLAWASVAVPHYLWIRRMVRQDPLLWAIDALLLVLYDLRTARGQRDMQRRLIQCSNLNFAAHCLTRHLLPSLQVSHSGSRAWLAQRAAGWSEALWSTQRQMIASVPGRQGKVESMLAHEIRCLATGDLGALAWHNPPPAPPRQATLRRRAIATARAIVVAVLPLVAVLVAQPFIHANSGLFGWARLVTAIWALLYVLLSIDPAIHDKIGAARDLAGLLQAAPGPASRDSQHRR